MIQRLSESTGNVVGYKAIGEITASDYLKLEPEVRDLVEKEGNVRMLIDLTDFQWEKVEAGYTIWNLDMSSTIRS